jgi:uncharacterized membrane protein YfcA
MEQAEKRLGFLEEWKKRETWTVSWEIRISNRALAYTIIALKFILGFYLAWTVFGSGSFSEYSWDSRFFLFLGVGFVAQLIDGALGMAYGLSCTSLLYHLGVSPKIATAAVHTAEVFTTGASGLSHLKFQNLDRSLFFRLLVTGVIGSSIGAFLISDVISGDWMKPYISLYLTGLGFILIWKGFRYEVAEPKRVKAVEGLAFCGGMLDAIGGGGWGPIVTSNLVGQGSDPRRTIGTVNTAEFFISFVSTGIFIFFTGVQSWQIVLGLMVGGMIAAPFGGLIAARTNPKLLLIIIGFLLTGISIWSVIRFFG